MTSRYHAYISYSHTDERFAAWLQRALESYRLPKSIAPRFNRAPLKPIFRDRSDLQSSANLGETLTRALKNSSALIVICSSAATASRWVNEEIRQYREMHGHARIFAIIARDEPPDCFPEALLVSENGMRHEPIAADARRNFDGRRDALLKLIAGLLEVEFDDLKRRDIRRHYQRMTTLATAATGMAGLMLALAIDAYNARNDANRRSAQAEDLIGFMLGDLRTRLEPIGRLDVLDAVGDKAMAYFSTLQDADLTPASRLGRAQALRQIGEVRMAQGNLAEALVAFQNSNVQSTQLVTREPDDNSARFELSQSYFWIGYVHYSRDETAEARKAFEHYLKLANELVTREPANVSYQTEVAFAHSNLGTLELLQNHFDTAYRHFSETYKVNDQQLSASSGDITLMQNLAETLSWLGSIAALAQSIEEATLRFRKEYQIRTKIAQASPNKASEKKLADAAMLLGHQLLLSGQIAPAQSRFEEAFAIGEALVTHDGSNVTWRRLRAFARVQLSRAATAQHRFDEALSQINAAVETLRQLTDEEPEHTGRHADLIASLAQQARLQRLMGTDENARATLDEALARIQGKALGPNRAYRTTVAGLYLLAGDLESEAIHLDQANAFWGRGLVVLESISDDLNEPAYLLTRIALDHRTLRQDEAAALQGRLNNMGFRDSADQALAATLIDGAPTREQS